MNKFSAVFLTALLAAGITMAEDPGAKMVAMERLNSHEFLIQQNTPGEQVNRKVFGAPASSELSDVLGFKNSYGELTGNPEKEGKSKTMEMFEKTEEILKNTMEKTLTEGKKMVDYFAQAGKNAVKEAKKELPGALEKTKAMAKITINYIMEMMSAVMNMISKSWDKMIGKDESKAQKRERIMDPEDMLYDASDSTNTSINQDDLANTSVSSIKSNAFNALNMEGR